MKFPISLLLSLSIFACGEKEEEIEEEDFSMYCGESSTQNLIADDADCDGAVTDDDCDDADADSTIVADDGDCDTFLTADDCDDSDEASTVVADDGDCDTILTADDCDDADADSTAIADDADCDGTLTADDCDDEDEASTIIADDADCDTVLTADDCDDADEASTTVATDADCDTFLTADDCDDANPYAYPGTGANEAHQSNDTCYSDMDGDGFGDANIVAESFVPDCYLLEMVDAWGDGWNGNEIEVMEDGVSTGIYSNDSSYDGGESHWEQHCIAPSTLAVDFLFHDGGWNSEVEFTLYYDDGLGGQLVAEGYGQGSDDFVFDGTTYSDIPACSDATLITEDDCDDAAGTWEDQGVTFYSEATPLPLVEIYGSDCDDADVTLHPGIDLDGDTFNACDDCDDSNEDINPGMDEEYYDGIDSNCDGMSDYDMDMDGYDSIEYTGACSDATLMNQWDCEDVGTCSDTTLMNQWDCEDVGTCSDTTLMDQTDCEDAVATWTMTNTWTSAGNTWTTTGMDCLDDEALVHPLAMEADPTACYLDIDGDGYGNSTITEDEPEAIEIGVINGTDCNDEDADMIPGYDGDADGADSCNDCDDTDPLLIGQTAYEDLDGDGFGSGTMMWVCELDEDADGTDDYSVVGGDCYDSSWSSSSMYIYPGAAYNEPDIDGDGVDDCTEDSDGDGYGDMSSWYADVDGTDCDDDDADLNPADLDADGYATCEDLNGLSDCDDDDATTYPGAGFMEAGFDSADYSTYECVTDGDGDGYSLSELMACYLFELEDSWGDGWNGGMNIEVFADSVSAGTATVSSGSADGGYSEDTTICVADGAVVEFVFNQGSYASETAGTIYGADGTTVLGTISGAGASSSTPQSMDFDSVTYFDGEAIFSETAVGLTLLGGTDSDDTDSSVN